MADAGDLDARMAFLMEADRLKSVGRATRLADGSRFENSAEHSWHLTLFALTLAPHAPDGVDTNRVIRMLILHDLVEIYAGDTPIFAEEGAQMTDEAAAADRIFGLLPAEQAAEFRALWDEFEAAESPDARFAKSLDRFQPPNQNLANGGGSWTDYAVTEDLFRARVGTKIDHGAPALWAWLSPKIAAFFQRS
ncbi:MAG: HD domain-containing protein [Pseudomonadota bacterium]